MKDDIKEFDKELIYFADPMCSWCWGFEPVIKKIINNLGEGVGAWITMGGLRPYTKEVLTPELKKYILDHWHHVKELSGQDFDFSFEMGQGFIYDTEPPSRAVATIREINPLLQFQYLGQIQEAFYTRLEDVTQEDVLSHLAEKQGIDKVLFLELFNSDELKTITKKDFITAQKLGIRGFPALLKRVGKTLDVVSQGYRSFEEIKPNLQGFIK